MAALRFCCCCCLNSASLMTYLRVGSPESSLSLFPPPDSPLLLLRRGLLAGLSEDLDEKYLLFRHF